MAKDFDTIVKEFQKHLAQSGKRYYSDFYIGTTNDIEQRMFKEHNVPKDNAWWIYRTAETADIAKKVETYFLEQGMRGDKKDENETTSNIVYCYAVSPTTAE